MVITSGKITKAQKIAVYGPEGIGKSSFSAQFPDPLFSDTEGSTSFLDVRRLPTPSSWTMLVEQAKYVRDNPSICKTYVIDTLDWATRLTIEHICATVPHDKGYKISGIEDYGYGKGYVYVAEEFGRFLNSLTEIIDKGIHVILNAHAQIARVDLPQEVGSYDRWQMKCDKRIAALVKEWADHVLFVDYKVEVTNIDGKGASKGKNKAQGGNRRTMYTTHHAAWDAKNRWNMPDEVPFTIPFDFSLIPDFNVQSPISPPVNNTPVQPDPLPIVEDPVVTETPKVDSYKIPKPLQDLMTANNVTEKEIEDVVAWKGYYPVHTPIENYDPEFINGVLVGAWNQVFDMVKDLRKDLPFK